MKTSFLYRGIRRCVPALVMGASLLPLRSGAQATLTTSPYVQHFDGINLGLPEGWQVDTGATGTFTGYNMGSQDAYFIKTAGSSTAWSNNSGAFKNMASVNGFPVFAGTTSALQMAATNRALGIRQVAGTDARVAFVFEIANTLGLHSFQLLFRLQSPDSNASRTTTWMVDQATGSNPTFFIPAATTGILTTGGNTYASNLVSVNFGNALDNQPGPVYIRIVNLTGTTGSGSRPASAIDDFVLSWAGIPPPTHIQLTGKTPSGNNVPLNTTAMTLAYNHPVVALSGQIDLYQSGVPAPVSTFTVPSPAVSITDSVVTLSNSTGLENNTHYYVRMTEGCFRKTGDTLLNEAITDSLTWSFTTADTTPPTPLPLSLTSLNETFESCNGLSAGGFTAYNNAGSQVWHCSDEGRNDDRAVQINGGPAAGISESNSDWLVSKAPFDLSAMDHPQLRLWQRQRFTGTAEQSVRISTDYIPGDNPEAATWTDLALPATEGASGSWGLLENIDLSPYRNTPFYLALTYTCGTEGAYELSYDDIAIEERRVQGIGSSHQQTLAAAILGAASPDRIRISVTAERPSRLKMELSDLYGKCVYSQDMDVPAGKTATTITDTGLAAGMYVLRISNSNEQVRLKLSLQ